jgi:hypothetical protein
MYIRARVVVDVEEGTEPDADAVFSDMDFVFQSCTDGHVVSTADIIEYEVKP